MTNETFEYVELEIIPVAPDTLASAKAEIKEIIEAKLKEAVKEEQLSSTEFRFEIEKTFPTDAAIIVGLTLLSGMALETFKALILPELKRKFKVSVKRKHKGKRH